jgi:hypothetical protein
MAMGGRLEEGAESGATDELNLLKLFTPLKMWLNQLVNIATATAVKARGWQPLVKICEMRMS